jgi:anti-sigma-K factor RskA
MNSDHDTLMTMAAAYALDALDGAEQAEFEAHLADGCVECEATLRESREALAAIAFAQPAAIPPPAVKAALLRRIEATDGRGIAARPARFGWARWAAGTLAASVAAAAFTAAFVAARYEGRMGQVYRETAAARAELQRQEAALRERLQGYQAVVDLLRDPRTRVVVLKGTSPAVTGSARVVWNERAGGHLFVADLPPAPAGKTYELWTIARGKPAPAGVFDVDASGHGSHRVAPAPATPVEVFAVSVEPAGGVPAPTGPIVLASSK